MERAQAQPQAWLGQGAKGGTLELFLGTIEVLLPKSCCRLSPLRSASLHSRRGVRRRQSATLECYWLLPCYALQEKEQRQTRQGAVQVLRLP